MKYIKKQERGDDPFKMLKPERKDLSMFILLGGFYFIMGPYQTITGIIIHKDIPLISIFDNLGGGPAMVFCNYLWIKAWQTGFLFQVGDQLFYRKQKTYSSPDAD